MQKQFLQRNFEIGDHVTHTPRYSNMQKFTCIDYKD